MPVFVDRLQRWGDDVKGRLAQVAVIDVARGTAKGAPLEITHADHTAFARRGHVDGKTGLFGVGGRDDVRMSANGDPAGGSNETELHDVTLREPAASARRENPWSPAPRMHLPMRIGAE